MSNIINKTSLWANTFPTTIPLLQKLKKCRANCKATPLTVPWPILLNIYTSVIHLYLTYGLAAWGQAWKTYLNKILILHKRVLRLPYFTDWHDHAIPLFLKANVLPTTFPYYESVSILMHDRIIKPQQTCKIYFIYFIFIHTTHDRLRLECFILKVLD